MLTTKDLDQRYSFLKITTSTGSTFSLTPSHLVPVGKCCSSLQRAGLLKINDTLFEVDRDGRLSLVRIMSVVSVEERGAIGFRTLSGEASVINNVLVSQYTSTILTHAVGVTNVHLIETPLRYCAAYHPRCSQAIEMISMCLCHHFLHSCRTVLTSPFFASTMLNRKRIGLRITSF